MDAVFSRESDDRNLDKGFGHIFNLQANPWLPSACMSVVEHCKQGYWKFNSNELSFHTPAIQTNGKYPTGRQLLADLNAEILLNANCIEEIATAGLVSEFLSEEEMGVKIVFLGTVFKDERDGKDYVRFMFYPEISALELRYLEEFEEPSLQPSDLDGGVRYWLKDLDEPFDPSYKIAMRKVAVQRLPKKSIWKKIAAIF